METPDVADRLRGVLELSTAHLDQHECALLSELGQHVAGQRYGETSRPRRAPGLPRVIAHEYGVIVMLGGADSDAEELAAMAELHLNGLAACFRAARDAGAWMLYFDADAEQVAGLPVFDW